MKQFLREWLDVPKNSVNIVTKNNVKQMVENAIIEALLPYPDFPDPMEPGVKDLRGVLERYSTRLLRGRADAMALEAIDNLLEPEKFIDDVVARIKNKQLTIGG